MSDSITINGVQGINTMAVGQNPLYPDPWEDLDGTEVFWDNFTSFSGWTVHSSSDMTTAPTVDTTASVMRAKTTNPCIDATTRTNGLIIMPEHTASTCLLFRRDISSVLTATGNWTMVSKAHLPIHALVANNSNQCCMGFSLPASNVATYNSAYVLAVETDAAEYAFQADRNDNGVAVVGEWITGTTIHPTTVWMFLFHVSGESTITAMVSMDGGRSLCEVGTISKSPSGYTNLFFWFTGARQMVTYNQFGLDYVRVYQSIKQR